MNDLMNLEYTLESGQKLTAETVKNYLVSGGGNVTDQEVLMFIELCKAQHLNPFIREAYLIKFGQKPATIVVGKDVFVKRAYKNKDYEGMKAGIIVQTQDGSIQEREGSVKYKGETLIGGWCQVYVKGHKFPIRSAVSMEEYSKEQSTWKTMPCVMIRKCAIVTALREAFPDDLQGLYDSAEMKNTPDILPEKEVEIGKASHNQKKLMMKIAETCGLCEGKNVEKLASFCESNGYELTDLTYDEAEEVIELLKEYSNRVFNEKVVDVEYQDVNESGSEELEGQVAMEV